MTRPAIARPLPDSPETVISFILILANTRPIIAKINPTHGITIDKMPNTNAVIDFPFVYCGSISYLSLLDTYK